MNSNTLYIKRTIVAIIVSAFIIIGCFATADDVYAANPTPPGKVTITKEITGYEAALLAWSPVTSSEGTVYYEVRQDDKVVDYGKGNSKKKATNLTDTKIRIPLSLDANGKFPDKVQYSVYAYIVKPNEQGQNTNWYSEPALTKEIRIIHPMYVSFKAKSGTKYYSSKSTKRSLGKLTAGKTYYAFGGARVNRAQDATFMVKLNGKTVYVKPSGAKNVKQKFSFKKPFTNEEVESFINDSGLNSKPVKVKGKNRPRRMIWVNTYNQRVYLFTGSKGNWKIEKKLPANTGGGKLLTPFGVKKISSKWDKKPTTGTRWWCIFNNVGIHQKLGPALGKPLSGGCVRIPTDEAKWFYNNISKRTTVLVY